MKKKLGWLSVGLLALAAIIFLAWLMNSLNRLSKLEAMNFNDMWAYSVSGNPDARIAVGILTTDGREMLVFQDGGPTGGPLESEFEIGSITKLLTSYLVVKTSSSDTFELTDSIGPLLELDEQLPIINELLTHTSGFKPHYLNRQMVRNFLQRQPNSFYGVTGEMILEQIQIPRPSAIGHFKYSNFGMAVLGLVLEAVHERSYSELITDFLQEVGMERTRLGSPLKNNEAFWRWQEGDAYLAAGGIISTLPDMMKLVDFFLEDGLEMINESRVKVDANSSTNVRMGIRIDSVGAGWMIDEAHDFVWHNGATSNFNSYLAIDRERGIGVVILSNLPPDEKIPATVMGSQLIRELQMKMDISD